MAVHRKLTKRERVRLKRQAKKSYYRKVATPKTYQRPPEFAHAPQARGEDVKGNENPERESEDSSEEENTENQGE